MGDRAVADAVDRSWAPALSGRPAETSWVSGSLSIRRNKFVPHAKQTSDLYAFPKPATIDCDSNACQLTRALETGATEKPFGL
jgi:hypothetical protein